jgi:dihydroorotate dehydrogenase electron transfer subunit
MSKQLVGDMRVVSQRLLVPRVYELVLEGDLVQDMNQPGQFIHIRVPSGELLLRRPISLASIDKDKNQATIIYRVEGAGTAVFAKLQPGDILDVMGPLGVGFPLVDLQASAPSALLIGGGIGVPPLYELAKQLKAAGVAVTALLGFGDAEQAFYLEEFKKFGEVRVSTDDGSLGTHGHIGVLLQQLDEEGYKPDAVYACGAPGMLRAVDTKFHDHPNAYISMEARMACGMGACYACVCHVVGDETGARSLKVCDQGPVFRTGEVVV